MRTVVIAIRKLSGRIIHGACAVAGADARTHVRCAAQRSIGSHWEYGHGAPAVIRSEDELPGRMQADEGWRGARRTDGAKAGEPQSGGIHGIGHDGAILRAFEVVDLADGVQPGLP